MNTPKLLAFFDRSILDGIFQKKYNRYYILHKNHAEQR